MGWREYSKGGIFYPGGFPGLVRKGGHKAAIR